MRPVLRNLIFTGILSTMAYFSLSPRSTAPAHSESPQQRDGRFHNVVQARQPSQRGWRKTLAIGWRFLFDKRDTPVPPQAVPVQPLTAKQLQAAPDGSLYRLGHSTL